MVTSRGNIISIETSRKDASKQVVPDLNGRRDKPVNIPTLSSPLRRWVDIVMGNASLFASIATVVMVFAFAFLLYYKALPIFRTHTLGNLLFSSVWLPSEGKFGFLNFILGTIWVTALSMIIAVPPSVLTALYLIEYAPQWVRNIMEPVVDLLAGIPSVVYGVWGVVVIVPFVRNLSSHFPGTSSTGYSVLAGGIVLALMIVPIMVSVMQEVLRTTPIGLREASLAVGATRWETTKYVVSRHAAGGLVAAGIMALSRAFGETMAVLMVVGGNQPVAPKTVFDTAYPLPALIANNYGEMMSIRLYDAALMMSAIILLAVVFATHIIARLVIRRMTRGGAE